MEDKRVSAPLNSPNSRAMASILASRPSWIGVGKASDLIDLPDMTILHAGPPLKNPQDPPAAILNSIILACIHEGWAKDELTAIQLVRSGLIQIKPSVDYRTSIPLAAVVSQSTPLTLIKTGNDEKAWHGFLGSGIGAQLRFGTRDLAVIERLKYRDHVLMSGLTELLEAGPVDLLSIARAALNEGDDLHNRLSSATQILHAVFLTRKKDSENVLQTLNTLLETPTYFLSQWIPACAAMLDRANGIPGSSIITNIAGNGQESAIQISGISREWIRCEAFPIKGPPIKTEAPIIHFPPHIGDSSIIDAYGLGGQALQQSPSLQNALAPWLMSDYHQRSQSILVEQNNVLDLPVGIDLKKIVATSNTPLISTGMVASDGSGLLGRGVGVMPLDIFKKAIAMLDTSKPH